MQQPDPPAPEHPAVPAAWFLLGFLIALAVFEFWALSTGHNTVSQMLQRFFRPHRWWKWVVGIGWVVLGWHLFQSFPW